MAIESTTLIKKERKLIQKSRGARLVLRNLPFACKENEVKTYFEKFGNVKEVTLLKKDGRNIGCGFIQFDNRNVAAKALRSTSGQQFMNRLIIVDWAVPKNKFQSIIIPKKEVIEKEEKPTTQFKIKKEDVSSENETSDSDSENDTSNFKHSQPSVLPKRRKPFTKNEKTEGETIFFKEIPFHVTNDDLKKCAEEIGTVEYAVICMDPLTEHSRGTGFIKFKDQTVAEQLLNNEKKLILQGKELVPLKYIEKDELENIKTKRKMHKDNRNLYLIKEGVIISGSPAAKGVSPSDMAKRLFLEQQKSRNLRNLHKFISRTRLVIYNLPIRNFDNKRLLNLFKTYAPKGAFINEARVMRNLKDLDDGGIPKSRGYGFVSFQKHEDALIALRAINNNPNIFSDKKRPIVSFSVENRGALNIKEKRKQKNKNTNSEENKQVEKPEVIPNTKVLQKSKASQKKKRLKKKFKKSK